MLLKPCSDMRKEARRRPLVFIDITAEHHDGDDLVTLGRSVHEDILHNRGSTNNNCLQYFRRDPIAAERLKGSIRAVDSYDARTFRTQLPANSLNHIFRRVEPAVGSLH